MKTVQRFLAHTQSLHLVKIMIYDSYIQPANFK